jgi:hypothetical protein
VEIRDMKLISAIPSRRFGVLLLAALLAGCATTPQSPRTQIAQADEKLKACLTQAGNRPEFAPVAAHFGDSKAQRYTIAQMADETVPTVEEARLWAAEQDRIAPCFKAYEDVWMTVRPNSGAIWADGTH